MYCVKCGVKLDDSLERCPLCGTPVWRPEEAGWNFLGTKFWNFVRRPWLSGERKKRLS